MSDSSATTSCVFLTLAEYRHLLRALESHALNHVNGGERDAARKEARQAKLEDTMRRKVRQMASQGAP